MSSLRQHSCPSCGMSVGRDEKFFPFCSHRCRLIDLGRWLNEDYRVAVDDREDSEQSRESNHDSQD